MKSGDLIRATGFLLLCEAVGITGALFTTPAIPGWYEELTKPQFAPPNWIFGPVWTILYAFMGIALYLVWKTKKTKQRQDALLFFAIQLGLNSLWSFLFFSLQQPLLAFIELVALWFFILLTVKKFYALSRMAGYLLLPYIIWVTFAAVLNLSIALLN